MKTYSSLFAALSVIAFLEGSAQAFNYMSFDVPGAQVNTLEVTGVSGGKVFGTYYDSQNNLINFSYDGTNYSSLQLPSNLGNATITGVSGSTIIGTTMNGASLAPPGVTAYGFSYTGGTLNLLSAPGAANPSTQGGIAGTFAYGISGSTIVGNYIEDIGHASHGYVFDGTSYTMLDDPFATAGTYFRGISGNTIVGYYGTTDGVSSVINHGLIYNGSTFTTLDHPLGEGGTTLIGVSGNLILGYYSNSQNYYNAFVYDGSTFTDLTIPGAGSTYVTGIDGDTIVGRYTVADIQNDAIIGHGFIGQLDMVPEPGSLLLVGLGASVLATRRRRSGSW